MNSFSGGRSDEAKVSSFYFCFPTEDGNELKGSLRGGFGWLSFNLVFISSVSRPNGLC